MLARDGVVRPSAQRVVVLDVERLRTLSALRGANAAALGPAALV